MAKYEVTVVFKGQVNYIVDASSEEEAEELESEYDSYEDYPDYIEEGYVSYFLEFTCSTAGTVSLISSNAYKIYIDGDFLGELSKAELIKMKWSISVLEEDI